MSDLLTITDLELWTHIGVPKEERETEQRILVTVEMEIDAKAAAKSDDVKKSVNYSDVTNDLKELAKKERKTIERFAEDVAQMILKKYKTTAVTVTVKKFAIPGARHVTLTIIRTK
ncbi:MAG: dihydroneopterin aldolase [Candidatus Peribacteraceae bacterium]|nr:dihydroneopterin aldolase [Candidatus Peribacteraceae bacterium]